MKPLAAALAMSALVAAAAPAVAGQLLDVALLNRSTGQRIPVYRHEGRLYVPGTPGERYSVYIANRTAQRVLAVVSVDGINAVTGETANPEQDGYVLDARQSFEINGWRKSMREVASFYFTRLFDSYAARTDRPDHVGVIGVAVFREWQPPRPRVLPQPAPAPLSKRSADAPAAEAESNAQTDAAGAPATPGGTAPAEPPMTRDSARGQIVERQARIGTGHGERERSEVVYTNFRRATSYPNETLTIYYDTHANLVAHGVIPRPTPVVEPNPFPGARFVPDPRS
ncbi:MAG TPA: hypothetical protein VLC47_00800 [Burkholderiales bacterium]|nr:hypothetical protein [Burkholderiales bacterium]